MYFNENYYVFESFSFEALRSDFIVIQPKQKPAGKENFESLYPCNETFEETLKKLEEEMTTRFERESHLRTSRQSISSQFFDKSQPDSTPT